ncbi:K+-transporting ATPase, B subunit [Beutenbergia cavernae DSM 12333]|uniref:Potassium-transporting ATPase ATP-binding subunit n=1 Tax=Beutenbergia cavernae (strain ATCC BAA-8 / DSM 12333 / CCUG 43141 / JCM 11478 / NBRC 16432 / NCIMB 13614 / HKI 0122) TaxID=471853 RepID=C5C3W4_BEUC1|nr:potassium-transporting ATPase subunit KdpB [Beutenbergia cavernae]ACQ82023.1 K+-transporting ATPase, B subunit [Beutenbergia cavernae DSM 12333]
MSTSLTPTRPVPPAPAPASAKPGKRRARALTWAQVRSSLPAALRKLDPRELLGSPVLFVVELGAVVTTVLAVVEPSGFAIAIAIWLWLTVLFGTLAEAIAESRGKAQASSLRATQKQTTARRVDAPADTLATGTGLDRLPTVEVPSSSLAVGDVVVVAAGETIPGDGDVIEGVASVDESAITGESAPVIRESGGDRSAVTGGTVVLSDQIVVRITAPAGSTFVDRMIALVEGSERQKTPNEIALNVLLTTLTIVFVLAVATLQPFAIYSGERQSLLVLIALLVCLIPTTIGALLSAIGIAGMDRLVQRNVLAMSGRAVEAAGDVDVLLLDKTGTITHGNRFATEVMPVGQVTAQELAAAARLSSLADETPEGRSIVDLVERVYPSVAAEAHDGGELADAELVPFTAQTRMSGIDLPTSGPNAGPGDLRRIRKGAGSAVGRWVHASGAHVSDAAAAELAAHIEAVSSQGGTPLVVAEQVGRGPARVLGVVRLKDVVKDGLRERFDELRAMGIRSVMVTGDNAITARAIAAEAGVDDVLAEATPEDKMALIRREQEGGRLVAMAGDGTNDAPALAQSDVGVAMNTGTTAAKEAGNMVDLDSNPTKLIEIVEIGKQLLITRGALTTFSVANDIAKYFAILPAMFLALFPQLGVLNIMQLSSPESAILSAVIFNALIILVLVPLALRGVKYRPSSASDLLRRNLLIYGVGGLIAPFIGIKLIDLVVSALPGF